MLLIQEPDSSNSRILPHCDRIFHLALQHVVENQETRFHIQNPNDEDYDLLYIPNNDTIPAQYLPVIENILGTTHFLPDYLKYDEDCDEKIYASFLRPFKSLEVDVLDEYSIAVTRCVLRKTSMPVYCTDARILWFFPNESRIEVVDSLCNRTEKDKSSLRITNWLDIGFATGDYSILGSAVLFHNLFFWQLLTDLPLSRVRYIRTSSYPTAGIGATISLLYKVKKIFASYGIRAYLEPGSSHYSSALLSRYFNFDPIPNDSDASNTIFLDDIITFSYLYFFYKAKVKLNYDILNPDFRKQLHQFKDDFIGTQRCLGILIRGTDYIVSGVSANRKQASVREMVPMIDTWLSERKYDRIFLATEDADVLQEMKRFYGGLVVSIDQERFTVSEFTDVKRIVDLERKKYPGEEYEQKVEELMVKYFHSLYLLSQCDSFLCSGECSGWDMVTGFNDGRFDKSYKFAVGLEESPE